MFINCCPLLTFFFYINYFGNNTGLKLWGRSIHIYVYNHMYMEQKIKYSFCSCHFERKTIENSNIFQTFAVNGLEDFIEMNRSFPKKSSLMKRYITHLQKQ